MTGNPYLGGLNRNNMAYVNGSKLMIHIPGHDPIESTSVTFAPPPNQRVESMTYYYRRGTKYFFRGLVGRLVMSGPVFEPNVKLKRGESYQVKMSFN